MRRVVIVLVALVVVVGVQVGGPAWLRSGGDARAAPPALARYTPVSLSGAPSPTPKLPLQRAAAATGPGDKLERQPSVSHSGARPPSPPSESASASTAWQVQADFVGQAGVEVLRCSARAPPYGTAAARVVVGGRTYVSVRNVCFSEWNGWQTFGRQHRPGTATVPPDGRPTKLPWPPWDPHDEGDLPDCRTRTKAGAETAVVLSSAEDMLEDGTLLPWTHRFVRATRYRRPAWGMRGPPTAPGNLLGGIAPEWVRGTTITVRPDGHPGHFGTVAALLAEVLPQLAERGVARFFMHSSPSDWGVWVAETVATHARMEVLTNARPRQLRCFEHVLVPALDETLGDAAGYTALRQLAWARAEAELGAPAPRTPSSPPMVTLVQRPRTRALVNANATLDAVLAALSPQAQGRIVLLEALTPAAQVQLMRTTDVLVAVHGAALSNLLFLPPTATVVELAPYRLDLPLFGALAAMRALPYARWMGRDATTLQLPAGEKTAAACHLQYEGTPCHPIRNWPCHVCIRDHYHVVAAPAEVAAAVRVAQVGSAAEVDRAAVALMVGVVYRKQ
jgi:hypothetical protein